MHCKIMVNLHRIDGFGEYTMASTSTWNLHVLCCKYALYVALNGSAHYQIVATVLFLALVSLQSLKGH